ncbi:MAG TPA: tyrosine-type recombinase/integrase [Tepidisphaeraceae bacterium]|jgi:integrase
MASLKKRPGNPIYYIQFYVGTQQRRVSTETDSFQRAKDKLRQFEAAQARGDVTCGLPTKTPIADVLTAYVDHIRAAKTPKSAQTDIYYLRDVFGPVCEALKVTSRKLSAATKKRPPKPGQDRRCKAPVVEAAHFEAITTAQIAAFISGRMISRGLAPKTGNRLRDTLSALFTWAMKQRGVRMPGDRNPVASVTKYREAAPEIRFLTLKQIDEQLDALAENVQLQAMVATLIFAGVRREELLWLTLDDLDLGAGTFGIIRVRAKTMEGESWQPKTKRNRAVPISSRLRHFLDKWRLKRKAGTWLFPSPDGKRWDCDNFSSDLRTLNEKAKLPWGCLDFRHTFGSQLAMKGESLFKISALMGNSPEICRRHYAALVPEAMTDSVEFGITQTPTAQCCSAAS